MSIEREEKKKNPTDIVEMAYEGLLNKTLASLDEINRLVQQSKLKKTNFGWKLFELITSRADNCNTEQYPIAVKMLDKYFKFFPNNHQNLHKTYYKMIANMILGKGNTGFIIRNRNELNTFLSDFSEYGFQFSYFNVLQELFRKIKVKSEFIPENLFELINPFIKFESDLDKLLKLDLEEPIIIALLAEKVLKDSGYRFKEKDDYDLMNDYLDQAKSIKRKYQIDLNRRSNLFLRALLISLSYNEKIILYCFSNYFYDIGQLYDRNKNYSVALICYKYARLFFEKIGIEQYKLSSEAEYYKCLAIYYSHRNRYEDQSLALFNQLNALRKLRTTVDWENAPNYYYALTKYNYVKARNALYNSQFEECLLISDSFSQIIEEDPNLKESHYLKEMFAKIEVFQLEAQGKIYFNSKDYSSALECLNEANSIINQFTDVRNDLHKRRLYIYSQYVKAYCNDLKGDYYEAFQLIEDIFKTGKPNERIYREYVLYRYFLSAKISIMEEKLNEAVIILSNVVDREAPLEFFGEITDKIESLYDILLISKDFESIPEDIDSYIFNIYKSSQYVKYIKLRTTIKVYDLPVRGINCNKLKLDLEDRLFNHLILNFEKEIGIKISRNAVVFYSILENIILHGLIKGGHIKDLINDMYENGQKEPVILSHENQILNGNKRLAAIKLSKLISLENENFNPLPYECVNIVKIPEPISKSDKAKIKTESEYQNIPITKIKEINNLKTLLLIKELINEKLTEEEICTILDLNEKDIISYRLLFDLIMDFLETENFSIDFYLIQKYDLFDHFSTLLKILPKIGEYSGLEGRELIKLKKQVKNLTFIWLKCNITDEMIAKGWIMRVSHINKLQFIFNKPKYFEKVENILNKNIKNLEKIHKILELLVESIKIKEERRTSVDHSNLLLERLNYLKNSLILKKIGPSQKEKISNHLRKAQVELENLATTINRL